MDLNVQVSGFIEKKLTEIYKKTNDHTSENNTRQTINNQNKKVSLILIPIHLSIPGLFCSHSSQLSKNRIVTDV